MFLLKKKHRNIVYLKARIHLRSEAAKTYLSVLWWGLEPIIMMAVYYFVFAVLLQRRTEDFVVFLLVGLVSWQWLSNCINHGMNSVDGNGKMISQVKFPKIILPSVNIAMDTFKFAIVFTLLCCFIWAYGILPSAVYLALAPLLLTQYVFNSALTNLAALAPPFLPDIKIIISQLIRAGMFLSGIFYDFREFDDDLQVYFLYNPMAQMMEMYRNVLIHGIYPDFQMLGVIFTGGFLLLLFSYLLFQWLDPLLPRTLAER